MSKEWMPGAIALPIAEAHDQGSYTKTQLIYHSTGTRASARANRRYFNDPKVKVESTFIIDYNGEILQIMPASARADANGEANRRGISLEFVGLADEEYTPAQVQAGIQIGVWACIQHPIPCREIPMPTDGGMGWHIMFGAPGPWTSVRGKECPGRRRIWQVSKVIIPAVQGRLHTPTARPPVAPEDHMSASFLFHDGEKTYWRDGGDTIWIPHPSDVEKLKAGGIKHLGQLSDDMTARLVEAAKQ